MIQDIGAHLFDNGYIPDPPREDDVLLAFSRDRETRGQVIASQGEAGLVLPTLRDWERALDDTSKDDGSRGTSVQALRTLAPRMLFSIDRTRFYLVEGSLPRTPEDAFEPSYLNFLPINGAVLVPQFGDPNDAQALKDIKAAYPDREIIGIYTKEVIFGGGNIHCITQQQPKVK